jgi:hypothetical protein
MSAINTYNSVIIQSDFDGEYMSALKNRNFSDKDIDNLYEIKREIAAKFFDWPLGSFIVAGTLLFGGMVFDRDIQRAARAFDRKSETVISSLVDVFSQVATITKRGVEQFKLAYNNAPSQPGGKCGQVSDPQARC